MKIVHVIEPFAAGVAVFVKSLTETMPEDLHIVIHGERKQIMSAREVKRTFPKQNVRFLRWHSAQRSISIVKDWAAFNELYTILKKLKKKNLVDAVHLHSAKSGLLGRIACRMAGIRNVIYTPNGASFLASSNPVASFIYKQLEKLGHFFGGQVVCCSASESKAYEDLGIANTFVNNGIEMQPETTFKPVSSGKSKFCVITSGRIEPQKNPALFNAIAGYFEDFDQVEFIWAGDGQDRDLLKSGNILVTGWLDADALKEKVAQADIYLSTSNYEGLSFGVLEALALRKPVLLSNCTGNTDVIMNGLNGDIFNNETEAIMKILGYFNNREMVTVMGEYAQEICSENFDRSQNFLSYKNIYSGAQATVVIKKASSR